MDIKTETALKESIRKWEKIVSSTPDGTDYGTRNCSLCLLFYLDSSCDDDCPIKKASGRNWCKNTPFADWVAHHIASHHKPYVNGKRVECPECLEIAKAELQFLKSLLP